MRHWTASPVFSYVPFDGVIGVVLALAAIGLWRFGSAAWFWVLLLGVGICASRVLVPRVLFLGVLASVVMGAEVWLLGTTLVLHALGRTQSVAYLWSGVLVTLVAVTVASKVGQRAPVRWQRSDTAAVIVMGIVLGFIGLVAGANGYVRAPDGRAEYVLHGYFNGDTMTLFALTHRAEQGDGVRPLNPFAGNGPLEYPALLHASLAKVFSAAGMDIGGAAWGLTFVAAGTTVVLLFELYSVLGRLGTSVWWRGGGVLLVLLYGWDGVVFPQSHTFLTPVFLLLILLLLQSETDPRAVRRRVLVAVAYLCGLVLSFANAVLGTAAVATLVLFSAVRIRESPRSQSVPLWAGAAVGLVGMFLSYPPGQGGLGAFNVSYTAFPAVVVLVVPSLLVACGMWRYSNRVVLTAGSLFVVLPFLTSVTLFLSRRDIIADNASRFLYLLFLALWPLALDASRDILTAWRRAKEWYPLPFMNALLRLSVGGLGIAGLFLPALATLARTTDSLLVSEPRRVSADELEAFRWIRLRTPPTAVFARALERSFENAAVAPLGLPAFTGRAQLRSDFWLSPDDEQAAAVTAYVLGRGSLPSGVDYMFCGPERRTCPSDGTLVFSNRTVRILAVGHVPGEDGMSSVRGGDARGAPQE